MSINMPCQNRLIKSQMLYDLVLLDFIAIGRYLMLAQCLAS
jgi:hypothetical protein